MARRRRPGHRFAIASHAVHHHRLRRRPVLEVLEGRVVLTTFTVNSLGDAGSGSNGSGDLRYCINQANANDQANTIVFDSTVFGTPQTITLSGSQLELQETGGTQTITGPAAGVTISGGGNSRVFQVDKGVTASLSGLTISGGSTSGSGGGVFNYGSAFLSDCTLSGNSAADGGGGLDNTGTATLRDCTLSGNSAGTGGGVFNHDAATLTACTLSGNSAGKGGGLYDFDTANLTDTIVAGNTNPSGASDITTIGGPNHVLGSNNLIGPGGSGGLVPGVKGNIVLTSLTGLGLAPLGNYGGPTQTMALLPGSLALGAGIVVIGVGTDQRGFPLDSPKPDIGAFQSQAELVVNTTVDSSYGILSPPGELSLRQAVGLFNFLGGPQTITFDPNVFATAQTIALTSGQLELSDTSRAVTITGAAAGVTISGGGNSRVFQVDSGVTVALSGLTISGGATSGSGGGLENLGTATLTGCTISGNSASNGGGVDNQGTARLTDCTLSGNSASSGGGGVDNQGMATLTGCTLSGNSAGGGGGVDNQGTATLTDCTLSGNSANSGSGRYHANSGGGGLENSGMATLTGCTVSSNSAVLGGGGLENDGTAYLTGTDCTLSDNSANHGGGVYNQGTADLTDCTVSGNSASGGGGLLNGYGTATLTDCTVSGNSAYDAGGMYIRGTANLTACTVSGNSASGKYSSGGLFNEGAANLTDTIIAGNTDPSGASDIAGGNVSGSDNLLGTGGSGGLVNGVDGNIVLTSLTELGLAPLGDYGGPTQTMALLPGSAAIGAGIAASGVTTDQRGFPLDSPNPDIGAFQTQPALVVNTTSDGIESPAGDLNLRQAVNLANVLTGAQSIRFDPTVFANPQTITLTGGQLELSNTGGTETIVGPAGGVTISGGGSSRVFQVDGGVTAALSGVTITGGSTSSVGGGLYNQGTATLTDCTLSGNSAGFGGGLDNSSTATVSLTDCTISGNSASFGGGLENAGAATLGTANLTDCTISGNSAVSGGGLENAGTATLTAATVSGNSASGDPAGPGGSVGGVYNHGKAKLTDTIVAGNTNPSGASDIGGARDVSGSANLVGTGGSGGLVNGVDGNIILTSLTELALAPLGNFGGPTQTMALLPGSPAIGAGIAVSGVTADQRGFPLDASNPDIGAFQTQPALVVNTTSDGIESLSGDLSLRQAVNLANVLTGAQSISFDASVFASPQTITLTGGQLELSNTGVTETIAGPAGGVTISGGGNSRVFQVDSGVTAALTGLTISGGSTSGNGGGLENLGTATITGCTISGNFAGSSGGGVDNLGTATLTGCTISSNSAGLGGGLYSYGMANLTLTDCTVSGNSAADGGGLYNYGTANLTLTDCTVSGNSAYVGGGGLENNRASVTLADCSVSGNSAKYGGGVYNRGVFNNYGLANLTLTGCTISGNSANFGGGLDNHGMADLSLADCTVSGNSALLNGGGVYNFANFYPCNLTLTGCTISGNYAGSGGGGVYNRNTATLIDTIVAGNTNPSGASDIGGDSNVSGSYNLIGTGGSGGLSNGVDGNIVLTSLADLGLAPLGNYGGPTQTMALLPGSAAIGAGIAVSGLTTDQRGFPLDSPQPDIGAFQSQPELVVNITSDGTASPAGDLSLGQAVNLANVLTGAHSIRFDPTVFASPQTITLTGGQLELSNGGGTETITGPAAGVTISGGGNSRVFQVDSGVTAALSGLTITGGSTSGNGGGLENLGTATLTDCTVSGNSASSGGGLDNDDTATLTLTDCTLSGNSASSDDGGGLENDGTATLTVCTLSANSASSGGGLENDGTATLTDAIVAGNTNSSGAGDIGGDSHVSGRANLVGPGGSGGLVNGVDGNIVLTSLADLGLAPLGNYGGPTQTMALLPGSAAIGAGIAVSGVTTDQRGEPLHTPNPDFGAFQSQGFTLTPSPGSTVQSTTVGSAFANPLAVTVTANNPVEPVAGGVLTFTAPASGPSANLSATSATIGSDGVASVTATANSSPGSYTVTASAGGNNATADFALTNDASLIPLTFSGISDPSITYGTASVTVSGTLANSSKAPVGESVAVTLGGVRQSATIGSSGAFSTTFDTAGLAVAGSPDTVNYAYTSDGTFASASTSSSLTITAAALTITADRETKVYGTADPALAYTASGFQFTDTARTVLTGSLVRAQASTLAGEQAGGFVITQGTLAADSNYSISFTGNTLTINPATLTVDANPQTKVYGTADPTLTVTPVGLVDATVDGVAIDDTVATALSGSPARAGTLVGEQVGSDTIAQGTLTADGNYRMSFTGSSLTITPATLTITAGAQTKVYGTSDPSLTDGVTELVDTTVDGVTIDDTAASVLTGSLARAQAGTLAGEQAGGYAIAQGTLAADGNYTIQFTGSTLTITPASLTVTANAQSKVYGTADPALTVTATGLVNTTVDGVTIDDTAATNLSGALVRAQAGSLAGEQVGDDAITQGTLATNSNYTIDFTPSTLTINPASLTVTANPQTKVYGSADPSLTYTATGLINTTGDGVTIADTAGTVLTGHLVRAAGETVSGGPYAITQGTLAANSNYTIHFTGSALYITPATMTIVADQVTKVFGSADPTLAYTCSGFQFSDTAATVLTGSLARAAGETVSGSPYAIGQGTLTAGGNYAIHFTGSTLTITPATPTLNVNAPDRVYTGSSIAAKAMVIGASGAAAASLEGVAPTLTYYVGSETSGTALGAAAPSAAGTYTVVASFPGSADYAAIQSTPTTFVISPSPATIALSSSASTAVYGQAVTFTATVTSSVGIPSGTVTFFDGASPLATVALNGSRQAALSLASLVVGSHAITATYNGAADFLGKSSSPTTETVAQAATSIVLVPRPVMKGKKTLTGIELTAEVEPVAPGVGVPTGQVTFEFVKKHGKKTQVKTLGTAAVTGGAATLTFKPNAVVNQSLVIVYSGDPDFLASMVRPRELTKRTLV